MREIDSLIRTLLTQGHTQNGVTPKVQRIPFYFGSVASTGISGIPVGMDLTTDLLTPDLKVDFSVSSLNKLIRLGVNPSEMSVTPYVRIAEVKTGGGRTYFHWLDEDNKAMEAYILTMRGTTGNLFPGTPESKAKLYWWMRLREMTMEPYWVMDEMTTAGGRPTKMRNYQYIVAQTIGLPTSVLFLGFYRKPIALAESSNSQYNIPWDFEFVIEQMYPRIDELTTFVGGNLLPELDTSRVLGTEAGQGALF